MENLGLLFAVMFVFSQLLVPFSTQEDRQSNATCPKNFSFHCGSLGWLKFPYTNLSYPNCGLLLVDCSAAESFPKIALEYPAEQWFEVKSIKNFTITLEFQYLQSLLDSNSCASFYYNSSLPKSPSISFTILNTSTLFICHPETNQKIKDYFLGYGYRYYNGCSDYYYFTLYYMIYANSTTPRTTPPPCPAVFLPMNKKVSQNNKKDVHEVFRLLAAEFDLQWQLSDDCYDCLHRGGICRRDWFEGSLCTNTTNPPILGAGKKKLGVILGTVIGGAGLIFLALAIFLIKHRKKGIKGFPYFLSRNTSKPSSKLDLEGGSVYFGVSVFSYSELEEATNRFDACKELGDGGFGTVYYGKLRDGREVAVKRLYEHNFKRMEQFMNEIEILTRLRHPNLVTLYGCTSRHCRELLLVYEYVANGTVADHLHGDKAKDKYLTWAHRMNIAIETADALAYLHASDTIHRDVKTSNILLGQNFCVKVADFGLSRLFPNDVSHISTAPQGTPGYVDPEYHQCYQLTDKSDVYSFGVVLIELISSMPAVDISRHRHDINLANLAINRIQRCAFDELIDPSIGYKSDTEVLRMATSVAELAFQCLQGEKEMRPTMEEVSETLKEIQNCNEVFVENTNIDSNEKVNERSNPGIPPSPESEDRVLLKNAKFPTSPNSVTNVWVSSSSTASTSR